MGVKLYFVFIMIRFKLYSYGNYLKTSNFGTDEYTVWSKYDGTQSDCICKKLKFSVWKPVTDMPKMASLLYSWMVYPFRLLCQMSSLSLTVSMTLVPFGDALVAFNFSFEDLPNFSVGKNWLAHRILRSRLSIKQLLVVQFESVLVDFFEFENWKHGLSPVIPEAKEN